MIERKAAMKQPVSKFKRRFKRVCIILLVTVLSYVLLSVAGSVVVFRFIFARTDTVHAFELTYHDIDAARYPRREISFLSGENRLRGCVYRPQGDSRALVLVLNGMNACIDRHLPEILYFVDHGFAVMTFENTGVGESEGDGTVGLAQARLDAGAAMAYIRSDSSLSALPLLLYGHSLGGYAAATALCDSDEVCAAVCVAGFNSPNENMLFSARRRVGVLADMQYPFMCLQNFFLFGDKADSAAVDAINACGKPVLLVGSDNDETVPPDISITGRQRDITNPNAVVVKIDEAYRDRHSAAWLSRDAAQYLAETENPTDKQRANVLDGDFMQNVTAFFDKVLFSSQ